MPPQYSLIPRTFQQIGFLSPVMWWPKIEFFKMISVQWLPPSTGELYWRLQVHVLRPPRLGLTLLVHVCQCIRNNYYGSRTKYRHTRRQLKKTAKTVIDKCGVNKTLKTTLRLPSLVRRTLKLSNTKTKIRWGSPSLS